jgi:hypothetical protein
LLPQIPEPKMIEITPIQSASLQLKTLFHTMGWRGRRSPPSVAEETWEEPSHPHNPKHEAKKSSSETKLGCTHPETSPFEMFREGLPMELWFLIVQHALEPRFAIMHEFLPQDLHFFYISLIIHPFSCPDRTEMKRTKGSLRLVCKGFNSIVNDFCSSKEQNPSWIWSYSPDNAPRYGPCARLDTRFHGLDDISMIKKQYQHEVGTLSIHIQRINGARFNPTLLSLLAEPWTLKVLHITVPGSIDISDELPLTILSGLPSLQTLSIAAQNPFRFAGELSLPQLTTLFLTCTPGPQSDASLWSFPKLKNLAIDARGWPCRGNGDTFGDLFKGLVQRHKRTISSLRLIPMLHALLHSLPSRRPLPQLEALATDFVKYQPQSVLASWSNHVSISHITHISTSPYTWNQLSKVLLETLKWIPSIRTLAITEDPFLETGPAQDVDREAERGQSPDVDELEKLCRSRGVRIIGKIGSDVCCLRKAYHALTAPQM